MDRDELFVHTMLDLHKRVGNNASTYDVIVSSALVRKLILDGGGALVSHVNMRRREQITYAYVEFKPELFKGTTIPLPTYMIIGFAIDAGEGVPSTMLGVQTRGRLKDFLAAKIALIDGKYVTVKDIIRHAAHVSGGVHAGEATEDSYKTVEDLDVVRDALNKFAMDNLGFNSGIEATSTLKGIGRATFRALSPLLKIVHDDLKQRGIDIPMPW